MKAPMGRIGMASRDRKRMMRSRVKARLDMDEAGLKEIALADEAVKKWIEGKAVKNFIVVPNKLVNIVV